MNIASAVSLALLVALLGHGVIAYNGLVGLKHGVARAWSNIDVLLRQRHEELPKLVETCRQYQAFEAATLARVTEARASVATALERHDLPALGAAESLLRAGLGQIFAIAEAYPELKANEQFMQLQARISALENGIADRRELYNEAANLNNTRIEQFPDLVLARLFGFTARPLLEFTPEQTADVDLKALFKA